MKDSQSLIQEQLQHAGAPCSVPPELLQLENLRVTLDKMLPPMEFLFRLFGRPCFPRGELVAVTGKAKCGKTFFTSMLMTACLQQQVLALERERKEPMKVLWYDTEQSEQSTQEILCNRISKMCSQAPSTTTNLSDMLYAYNLRGVGWKVRRRLLPIAIAQVKPFLVILDGMRDLVSDINDGVEAQLVVEQLMTIAQHHRCCIVCVLHQNKSDGDRSMRGWIGTELTNKVFEVYNCEKLKDSSIFKVEQTMTRKQEIGRKLYYSVDDENGLPVSCDAPLSQPRDAIGRFMSTKPSADKWETFNQQYIIHHPDNPAQPWQWNLRRLFTDALEGRSQRPFGEVMGVAMKLSHIEDKYYYYARFEEAVNRGLIRKETSPGTGTQYVVLCDEKLPF